MRKKILLSLASASLFSVAAQASPFASSVVNYNPGAGISAGYANSSVVIGQPSTGTATHPLSVTPCSPASGTNQILAIASGGSLTVRFEPPIVSSAPGNPYGVDFLIFGNSYFVEGSNGAATGQVYSDPCEATVSVSSDGATFYELNPALAPQLNDLYPTDGSGNFQIPANPALTDFTNLTLAQIRSLYAGSAGGTGYEIEWAQDASSNSAPLYEVSYVRIDVQSGEAWVGGFAAVSNTDRVISETFSNNPALDGWKSFGDTNLFAWDSVSNDLRVTWDSSQSNSYFYHPLGTILTSNDAFGLSFDIQLNDAGTNADGTYQFELAVGFLNLMEAEGASFFRGSGENATNLAEFNYFPADGEGDGPSLDATLLDTNLGYYFAFSDVALTSGAAYHVTLNHAAGTAALTGEVYAGFNAYTGLPAAPLDIYASSFIGDFRLDAVAISSYSDVNGYGASLLAHGTVKNILVTVPPPPVGSVSGAWTNGAWQVQFASRANWNYTLMKSSDLQTWSAAGPAVPGTGAAMALQDASAASQNEFYRVSASLRRP